MSKRFVKICERTKQTKKKPYHCWLRVCIWELGSWWVGNSNSSNAFNASVCEGRFWIFTQLYPRRAPYPLPPHPLYSSSCQNIFVERRYAAHAQFKCVIKRYACIRPIFRCVIRLHRIRNYVCNTRQRMPMDGICSWNVNFNRMKRCRLNHMVCTIYFVGPICSYALLRINSNAGARYPPCMAKLFWWENDKNAFVCVYRKTQSKQKGLTKSLHNSWESMGKKDKNKLNKKNTQKYN